VSATFDVQLKVSSLTSIRHFGALMKTWRWRAELEKHLAELLKEIVRVEWFRSRFPNLMRASCAIDFDDESEFGFIGAQSKSREWIFPISITLALDPVLAMSVEERKTLFSELLQLGMTCIRENTTSLRRSIKLAAKEKLFRAERFLQQLAVKKKEYLFQVVIDCDGFGSANDLKLRDEIEVKLNQFLEDHELGYVDGTSSGGGEMEVGFVSFKSRDVLRKVKEFLEESRLVDEFRIDRL
jgi:hypothetical protein